MKVYGIKNCDTVKKALNWLQQHSVEYEFHDFKKSGISESKLKEWSDKKGWETLLNKKGLTWRRLEPEQQQTITSEETAIELMQEKTSIIKRPVIETDNALLVGFNEEQYRQILLK